MLREKEADCWAMETLTSEGYLDKNDVKIILNDISNLSGDGWIYSPGPERSLLLSQCVSFDDYENDDEYDDEYENEDLYCCDATGTPRCKITINPGPIGSPCGCAGIPGIGYMCQ